MLILSTYLALSAGSVASQVPDTAVGDTMMMDNEIMMSDPMPVDPERWAWVTATRSGTIRLIRERDRGRISTRGRVWVKDDHSADASKKYRETKTLIEIDCKNETSSLISIITYDKNGGMLQNVEISPWNQRHTSTVPESVGAAVQRFVCAP